MSHAVDLPAGSIVATYLDAYIKDEPSTQRPWRSTGTGWVRAVDEVVETLLINGAMVVRYGYELCGSREDPETGDPVPAHVAGYPLGHHRLCLPDSPADPP